MYLTRAAVPNTARLAAPNTEPRRQSTFPAILLAPSANDPDRRSSTDTIPHQGRKAPQTGPVEEPAARRTSPSSSNNVEHVYPPTPQSARPSKFHHASYPDSYLPSEVNITESLGTGTTMTNAAATTPAAENLCQYVFNKIKAWFDRLLGYLSMKPL
ncbi:hypothetical protein BYT27DRAFT_7262490 [Phlegmacium glaucopus]|nr:hypothetical protein BYT27DRAFT_7262490 [Phlegmacium glaucopus]